MRCPALLLPLLLAAAALTWAEAEQEQALTSPEFGPQVAGEPLAQLVDAQGNQHAEETSEGRAGRVRRGLNIRLVFHWAKKMLCRLLYKENPSQRRQRQVVSYTAGCRKGCQMEVDRLVFNDTLDQQRALEHCREVGRNRPQQGALCSRCVQEMKGAVGHCRIGLQWEVCLRGAPRKEPEQPVEHELTTAEPDEAQPTSAEPEETTTDSTELPEEPQRLAVAAAVAAEMRL